MASGVGATFNLRFGGKASATSGQPVDAEVTVIGLARDAQQSFGVSRVRIGDVAGVRIGGPGGLEVSLLSHRSQALGLEIFSAVNIDLASKRYIGVKSTNHFHAAYGPIATKVIYCDGGGPSPRDVRQYPYRKIIRPMWPHDELPEARLVV
jgi:microcystin degradation protein MlrC